MGGDGLIHDPPFIYKTNHGSKRIPSRDVRSGSTRSTELLNMAATSLKSLSQVHSKHGGGFQGRCIIYFSYVPIQPRGLRASPKHFELKESAVEPRKKKTNSIRIPAVSLQLGGPLFAPSHPPWSA